MRSLTLRSAVLTVLMLASDAIATAAADPLATLTVAVVGARNGDGTLGIALYRNRDGLLVRDFTEDRHHEDEVRRRQRGTAGLTRSRIQAPVPHAKPVADAHAAEQQSPSTLLPSSQYSPRSTVPSPQIP